eukprot:TRINITY_DN4868_c0_g1_i2.p1 TRINITY_DN4868_c0_g1~~TRINITY_DN4868_c0_g1_i2.p1  ORF type:complete len:582 (-),score=112.64 TRINITY_DN4868_c0_g1_i2:80-1825(-)
MAALSGKAASAAAASAPLRHARAKRAVAGAPLVSRAIAAAIPRSRQAECGQWPAAVASTSSSPIVPSRTNTPMPMYAMLLTRRPYLDSVDRAVTVKSMDEPLEVLEFMEKHSDSDTRTHEAALRRLGKLANGSNYKDIVGDGRFHSLLSSLASRFDDCDTRVLGMIADASARFLTSTPELSDFAERLAEVVCHREDAFSARSLASVALALAMRGTRNPASIEFIRTEAMKMMNDLEPSQCSMLLEAFRRWGVFDKVFVDLIVERMCDEIDRFSSRDVVDVLGVASRMGLARGFLLRRLCTLAFDNLRQFSLRELVSITYSLAKLRFLTSSMIDDVTDVVAPDIGRLAVSKISELLFAIAMVDARHKVDLVRVLIEQYADVPGHHKTLTSLADFSWAVCSLQMVNEYPKELKAALGLVFDRPQPPQNRVPLMKLFDVIVALELEGQALKINVPREWRAACDDATRYETERLEGARLHNEILLRFDNLSGSANGLVWQLRMLRAQPAGPFRVDFLDEETKIALDVEIISWPTSRRLKHRLLKELGFHPLRLEYWEWRRARTEEEQNSFLQREITNILEALPRA